MLLFSYKKAKAIIKQYGTGYYRATFLFPKKMREAIWIYYQFVRTADEVVDDTAISDHEEKLARFETEWCQAEQSLNFDPFFNEYIKILNEYSVPREYNKIFLKSMKQDLTVSRYQTYDDLEEYMYGSAVVVGYTISHLVGFRDGAFPYARALAEAFQMTNFLRDIKSDYDERGRIYIPKEDMDHFGVLETHIAQGVTDDAWKALMQFEIARSRTLYAHGVAGISYLDPKGRKAVYAAALIYKDILDGIEKNDYDIFSKRIIVSPFRKTVLLWKALWYRNQ